MNNTSARQVMAIQDKASTLLKFAVDAMKEAGALKAETLQHLNSAIAHVEALEAQAAQRVEEYDARAVVIQAIQDLGLEKPEVRLKQALGIIQHAEITRGISQDKLANTVIIYVASYATFGLDPEYKDIDCGTVADELKQVINILLQHDLDVF